jgi:hypothetical protein
LHVFSSVAGYWSGNISKRPYWELIPLSTSTTARTAVIELKEIEKACDRMNLSNNRSSAAHESALDGKRRQRRLEESWKQLSMM